MRSGLSAGGLGEAEPGAVRGMAGRRSPAPLAPLGLCQGPACPLRHGQAELRCGGHQTHRGRNRPDHRDRLSRSDLQAAIGPEAGSQGLGRGTPDAWGPPENLRPGRVAWWPLFERGLARPSSSDPAADGGRLRISGSRSCALSQLLYSVISTPTFHRPVSLAIGNRYIHVVDGGMSIGCHSSDFICCYMPLISSSPFGGV